METTDGNLPTTAERTDDRTEFRTRSRRVSFAETTDIHFFNKDEDYDTPPSSSTPASNTSTGSESTPLHFVVDQREDQGSRHGDGDEGEDEDEQEEHEPFVKNVVDSSPGSTFGSATSNEDYNLFGPVSSSFIKTGQSEASDNNNNDITLDSATFSMHFRNVVPRGDLSAYSMESLKTPTGDSMSTSGGDFMTLTGTRMKVPGEVSGPGLNSNSGMSFITPNSEIDFQRLPSKLEALLVKVNESQTRVSPNRNSKVEYSSLFKRDGMDPYDSGNEKMKQTPNAIYPANAVQNNYCGPGLSNLNSAEAITHPFSSPSQITKEASAESPLKTNSDQERPRDVYSSAMVSLETPSMVVQKSPEQVPEHADSLRTPNGSRNFAEIPTPGGSISSLYIKRQDLILDPSTLFENHLASKEIFSLELESIKHGERISAIMDSISKFKSTKSIKDGVDVSKLFLPQIVNLQPEFEAASESQGLSSPVHHDILSQVMPTSFKRQSPYSPKVNMVNHGDEVLAMKKSTSKLKNPESLIGGFSTSRSQLSSREHLQYSSESVFDRDISISSSLNGGLSITTTNDNLLGVSGTIVFNGSRDKNEMVKSPSKESHLLIDAEPILPIHLNDSILKSTHSSHRHDSPPEVDTSAEVDNVIKKRNVRGLSLENSPHLSESERIQKVRKVIPEENSMNKRSPGLSAGYAVDSGAPIMGNVATVNLWNNIFLRVSGIASKPLLVPINMLDLEEIDIFEDKLSSLQRTRKFERLYMDIQSMKKYHQLSDEQRKRLSEVKLLQDMLVYEKAKLLLVKAHREKLLIKTQNLHFGIEECNKLSHALLDEDHIPGNNGTTMRRCLLPTSAYSSTISQVEQNKVTSMKQELQNLENKLKQLKIFFKESCNVKENASFDEIIDIVSDYLKKRNYCRLILKKLLIWELIDVINEKDQCHVLLSYQNLLRQRYTIKASCGSSLFIRNSVDAINVEKRFPNMGACTAFNFIFPIDYNCNLSDSTCFMQQTQRTSFVLGNLLNLLKEVQAAWLDIGNLTSSKFYCRQHSDQLELELIFINLKNGMKVVICLDMTNLKRGIYPSEPSELHIQILDGKRLQPSPIASEIMTAIHDLKDKYSAIVKLCQRVSYTVQSCQ